MQKHTQSEISMISIASSSVTTNRVHYLSITISFKDLLLVHHPTLLSMLPVLCALSSSKNKKPLYK